MPFQLVGLFGFLGTVGYVFVGWFLPSCTAAVGLFFFFFFFFFSPVGLGLRFGWVPVSFYRTYAALVTVVVLVLVEPDADDHSFSLPLQRWLRWSRWQP
jgi:hypothetical protein